MGSLPGPEVTSELAPHLSELALQLRPTLRAASTSRPLELGRLDQQLAVTARLTSGYHRDLQLIKAPLFRAVDLAEDVLDILARTLPRVSFISDNIQMAPELLATDDAYRLVVTDGSSFTLDINEFGTT